MTRDHAYHGQQGAGPGSGEGADNSCINLSDNLGFLDDLSFARNNDFFGGIVWDWWFR